MSDIAARNGRAEDWLDGAVAFHLSPPAACAADHVEFGSFPQSGAPGLDVIVPTALHRLALESKAMRVVEAAKGDFLQAFYAADAPSRAAVLADEPSPLGARHDAMVGGFAGYLLERWAPEAPPPWTGDRSRYLDPPWFPNAGTDLALMESLTYASPSEFESRNVTVDEEALRRADRPRR